MRSPVRPTGHARPTPSLLPLLGSLVVVATLTFASAPLAAYQTERVALVIIDGLRYSDGLGDPNHTYVPEMWALAQQGAVIEPFQNDGITYTSRAIPAIWCGAWTEVDRFPDPDCWGQQNNHARLPTIFEYYRKQLARPEEDCIYVLKDVGCVWKASFDVDYGPTYWPLYHSVGSNDVDVWQEAVSVLDTYEPSFFLLYLSSVDHEGHSGSWSAYTQAIATADSIVGVLWSYLQSHLAYAGKTTLFVTNDHGRHDYDFSGHGDGCSGCRTIQLLAVGPDVRAGHVSTLPRAIPDVTPTIGELLGFAAEQATGSVMDEILLSVTNSGGAAALGPPRLEIAALPNPFNPRVQIRVSLTVASRLSVSIYDVEGRRVRTLLEPQLHDAGVHRLFWEGRDDGGVPVASGIYLFRARVGAETRVTRGVLLR